MPPSGYSSQQSSAIAEFLRSCSVALEQEGRAEGRKPTEALHSECEDIDRALADGIGEPVVKSVLSLTREFYADVAGEKPETYEEFRAAVDRSLGRVERAVLAVHIEPPPRAVAASSR